MFAKKHFLTISTFNTVVTFCFWMSWMPAPALSTPTLQYSADEAIEISHRKSTTNTGKIIGKVTNTNRKPLSDITISIQSLSEEMIYGSSFEDAAVTDKKGGFKIDGLAPGKYILRATPKSDEFYLPNDKFNVKVKPKKSKKVIIKLSAAANTDAKYVGNGVCLSCHPEQKDWKKSAHATTISTPASKTVAAPFNGDIITTSDGKVKFKTFVNSNEHKVTLYDLTDESISVTYTIVRTHGGVALAGKQRYQVKIGDSHYILPIQYNNKNVDENNPNAAWVSYDTRNWYNTDNTLIATDANTPPNKDKSFEQNCEGCHVTGLNIVRNTNGEFISYSQEVGISCESCHGPGEFHVSVGGGNALYIVNPKYLAADRGNETCGQCHVRVKNKTGENGADFETEYPCIINGEELTPFIPGKVLMNYIEETTSEGKPTAGYWNDNDTATLGENASENNHSKQHRQQYQDFVKSYHYNYAGLKCYTCHDPHGMGVSGTAQLLRQSSNNKICVTCHQDTTKVVKKEGKKQNEHTKHPYSSKNTGGSLCTGCHMPKTAKTAVNNDISSHVFDIIRPHTSKAMADANSSAGTANNSSTVITNSCYGCHSDDADFGVERWNNWERED